MLAKAYASSIAKDNTFAHDKSNFIENLMEIKSLYQLLL